MLANLSWRPPLQNREAETCLDAGGLREVPNVSEFSGLNRSGYLRPRLFRAGSAAETAFGARPGRPVPAEDHQHTDLCTRRRGAGQSRDGVIASVGIKGSAPGT